MKKGGKKERKRERVLNETKRIWNQKEIQVFIDHLNLSQQQPVSHMSQGATTRFADSLISPSDHTAISSAGETNAACLTACMTRAHFT